MQLLLTRRQKLVRALVIRKSVAVAMVAFFASALSPTLAFGDDEALDWPAAATKEDLDAARAVLIQWSEAYRSEDYRTQWRLTDSRIRHWIDLNRWRRGMRSANRRDGALEKFEILNQAAVSARQLPCTEQGHCYREGVRYVIFLVSTHYTKAAPPQPEYAAIALSEEGWRFGGGTFPNRPLGETAVIMTESDERRYKFKGLTIQK